MTTETQLDVLTETTEDVKKLMAKMVYGKTPFSREMEAEYLARELVDTDFDGNYGRAGTVLALNGSPPRGVIVFMEVDYACCYPPRVYFMTEEGSRRLGDKQAEVVRRWFVVRGRSDK
jgi:hypothetical protein